MYPEGEAGDRHRARRLDLMPGSIFAPAQVSSPLEAREERWRRKLALSAGISGSLFVLTLRMPHPLRMSYAASRLSLDLHIELLASMRRRGWEVSYHLCLHGADGPESYFLTSASPREAKTFAVAWEESHPLGSLADLDVMDGEGNPLSRESLGSGPRPCFVCGQAGQLLGSDPSVDLPSGAACAQTRAHPAWEVEAKIREIFSRAAYVTGAVSLPGATQTLTKAPVAPLAAAPAAHCPVSERIARAALSALLEEVALSPKPGLVSPDSRGSHDDMDYEVFLASARALAPYFPRFAELGEERSDALGDLLVLLRPLGIEAEKAMFTATGGVNTHKGLIFSLGLLCAAVGSLVVEGSLAAQGPPQGTTSRLPEEICGRAAAIACGIARRDFSPLRGARMVGSLELTAGEKLYLEGGIRGVRGEAEDGFPSVLRHALPRLEKGLAAGLPMDHASLDALLLLFTVVQDTNVLSRAGEMGLSALKAGAAAALAAGGASSSQGKALIAELDKTLRTLNASPGGCADLLAITFFLHTFQVQSAKPWE